MSNIEKCKYARYCFSRDYHYCLKKEISENDPRNKNKEWDEKVNYEIVSEDICNSCKMFKSMYIEYPIVVQSINNKEIEHNLELSAKIGQLVSVRVAGEENSYIGIYVGDLPYCINTKYDEDIKCLTNNVINNPAIFVPELNKIVYGCESWWTKINSVEEFKDITDEDIDNCWYVQLAKTMIGSDRE